MSARKRASGFALMDAAWPADRKFVRLAARASIPIEFAAAVGVYWLVLADARRSKSPDVDWSDYEEYGPQIQLLQSVGLLTDTGFAPDVFEKWAPAYRSPYDATRGTQGNGRVHNGTQRNATSVQFNSVQGDGGPGEGGAPQNFMGWGGKHTHDGRHGRSCMVCYPEQTKAPA
jgi:hypothetical protein